jgi:hypothetical protein
MAQARVERQLAGKVDLVGSVSWGGHWDEAVWVLVRGTIMCNRPR